MLFVQDSVSLLQGNILISLMFQRRNYEDINLEAIFFTELCTDH